MTQLPLLATSWSDWIRELISSFQGKYKTDKDFALSPSLPQRSHNIQRDLLYERPKGKNQP